MIQHTYQFQIPRFHSTSPNYFAGGPDQPVRCDAPDWVGAEAIGPDGQSADDARRHVSSSRFGASRNWGGEWYQLFAWFLHNSTQFYLKDLWRWLGWLETKGLTTVNEVEVDCFTDRFSVSLSVARRMSTLLGWMLHLNICLRTLHLGSCLRENLVAPIDMLCVHHQTLPAMVIDDL